MSDPPPSHVRWFGLKESRPAKLCLVKGPAAKPCAPEPFPFWVAVVIATAVLGLGAAGARYWLIPVLLLEEEVAAAPAVQIRNAEHWEEETKPLARMVRLNPTNPSAPRVTVPMPMPAMQPEELVLAEWDRPLAEPWEPSEILEEADLPFPTAKDEPKKAKPSPKPRKSNPKTTRRPEERPRSTPKALVQGESRPAQIVRPYQPPYPASARRAGTEGRVVLSVQVRSDGRVGSVGVFTSSGSAVLDSAAISAVKRFTFAPGLRNGQKITTTEYVPIRFQLE